MTTYPIHPCRELPPDPGGFTEVVRCTKEEGPDYFGLYQVQPDGTERHIADFATFSSAARAAEAMEFSLD